MGLPLAGAKIKIVLAAQTPQVGGREPATSGAPERYDTWSLDRGSSLQVCDFPERTMRRHLLPFCLVAFLISLFCAGLAAGSSRAGDDAAALDPGLLAGMKLRSIGPAAMSGRVVAVAAVESDPEIVYVGGSTSGVWKSTDGGLTYEPIFDDQPVASIGAIAIFAANPDVVWVGTGEGNPRNSASVGNGVYRSLDGGRTWQHLGLEKSEHIRRIVLHPTNPDVAYVAAEGREWGENPERGIYKTTDGGKTWKRVLYVDERSGGSELVMDPANPNKLFASLWDYRRWPWFFRSGGPGSGLYVTYDGGDTWKRLTEEDGLPKGQLGRIGLAIAPSEPRIVYALVEATGNNVVLRSEDGGRTWQTAGTDASATERPFYYADIRVDPQWPNRIYSLTSRLRVSDDGAKTFRPLGHSRDIHGDYHALWIDPHDGRYLIAGEDGGVGISRDRGNTWEFAANLPFGQYYHVAVDQDQPYNVYGGLQDNGAWRGPSAVWENGAIRNVHWQIVSGGDGFVTLPDPRDPQAGYAESQGGEIERFELRTRLRKRIKPAELSTDPAKRLRFNWNAAIAQDPFDPATIYIGSQYLFKSTDRGDTWEPISPDLTTNNPDWQHQDQSGGLTLDASGAENYCSILAIAPSAVERGVIWVGTDDGRVQVTRDGGKTWTSVEGNIGGSPGVPAHTWVPQIRASTYSGGGAFVVFDDHRRSNWTPYAYRTDDYGTTWKSLGVDKLWGYALSIEQDPVDRDLLFLGTEFGLYASFDGGGHWLPWKHGLPTVSVMDMVIHPRDFDLVLGTHGRSIFILDDITPLRQMTAATLHEPLHLYQGMPALEHRTANGPGAYEPGSGDFRGENRPYGALITYSLNLPGLPLAADKEERERKQRERASQAAAAPAPGPEGTPPPAVQHGEAEEPEAAAPGAPGSAAPAAPPAPPGTAGQPGARPGEPQVEIRISDAGGKLVRTMKGPAKLGVNRAVWDLGRDAFRQPPRGERGDFFRRDSGPQVPPGTYTVTVSFKGHDATGTVVVAADPATHNSAADWQAREAALRRIGQLQDSLTEAIERVAAARTDLDVVIAKLRRADAREEEKKKAAGTMAATPAPTSPAPEPATAAEAKPASGGRNAGDHGPAAANPLIRAARDLRRKLDAAERRLYVPPGSKGIVDDRTPFSRVQSATFSIDSSWDAPDATQRAELQQAESATAAALQDVNRLLSEDVAAFHQQVAAAHIDLLPAEAPIALPPAP
jgi:photosystem II stability/assembly factor-like uncharacterized protein